MTVENLGIPPHLQGALMGFLGRLRGLGELANPRTSKSETKEGGGEIISTQSPKSGSPKSTALQPLCHLCFDGVPQHEDPGTGTFTSRSPIDTSCDTSIRPSKGDLLEGAAGIYFQL